MSQFYVAGPFEIPTIKAVSKIPDSDSIQDLWGSDWSQYKDKRGVYVFGIRTGRATIPIYVGKATKGFAQECFTAHKIVKLMKVFATYKRGIPVIFFVCHPPQKGKTNNREIGEIESELMNLGYNKNPNIQNEKGILKPTWSIKGVLRSGKGQPSKEARQLKKVFDLEN